MRDTERSGATFIGTLLVIGILVASFFLPWFLYKFSSGQLAPSNGPQGTTNFVERERLAFYPFHRSGNATPDHPAEAERGTDWLGYLASAQVGILAIVAILELPIPVPFVTRRITLGFVTAAFLVGLAALAWAWIVLPATLDGHGVTGAFTSRTTSTGYVFTRLDWGWALGATATALLVPLFAIRFKTGSYDPAIVESYAADKKP